MGCNASSSVSEPALPQLGATGTQEAPVVRDLLPQPQPSAAACFPVQRFHSEYSVGRTIAEGSYGVVRPIWRRDAEDANAPATLAVKIVSIRVDNKTPRSKATTVSEVEKEADLWRLVGNHPNVLALRQMYLNRGGAQALFVMDLCVGNVLKPEGKRLFASMTTAMPMVRDMVAAVVHIHSLRILHRDIKPDNYLLHLNPVTVKLSDFGLALTLPDGEYARGVIGTSPYMSPEVVCDLDYDLATDVWSLGASLYAMLLDDYPYKSLAGERTSSSFKAAIRSGKVRPPFRHNSPTAAPLPQQLVTLMQFMLNRNPARRPSALEVYVSTALQPALELPLKMDQSSEISAATTSTAASSLPGSPTRPRAACQGSGSGKQLPDFDSL